MSTDHPAQDATPPGVAFLRSLWGDRPPGFVQLWTLAERRSVYLTDPEAARNFHGHADVYTAVGTTARRHGGGQRAKLDQIAALAGLWLDIDTGPNGVPNRTCALTLANMNGLRPTITVSSGTGVHAWYLLDGGPWIFRSLEERAEAIDLSARFYTLYAQAADRKGWRLDRSTRDITRLLRLPGTINAKDPTDPRPVQIIEHRGPRHALNDLRALLATVPTEALPAASRASAPVTLTGDTSAFAAKLDALLANSPEFQARWEHQTAPPDPSMSAYDLSLCAMAAGAMTDPELATLIRAHRSLHGSDGDKAKGQRTDYLTVTIAKARERGERDAQTTALERAGRRAA